MQINSAAAMSDHEKIDDHKNLDGDDDVGNGVCNAKGPL